MSILKCMIVDDESMSRTLVKKFIEKTDFLELSYEFDNGVEAASILMKKDNPDVDIVFLDIEMPEMSGMELLESVGEAYQIIMITAREEYAVKAIESRVTDYLMKPFEYSRFLKAVGTAKDNIEKSKAEAESYKDIYVKSDARLVRLKLRNIFFIEALADYVIFNTEKGKYIVHHTMKGIEKKLPESMFTRIHRSYIVNINHIHMIEDMSVVINEKHMPIGASYKDKLFVKLNML